MVAATGPLRDFTAREEARCVPRPEEKASELIRMRIDVGVDAC